jgi:hypothetical protein
MKTYVYVDGENHFVRSNDYWKKLHGKEASLEDITDQQVGGGGCPYPDAKEPPIRLEYKAKFFWDTRYPNRVPTPFHHRPIGGAVYYTVFTGGDPELLEVRKFIRKQGFDPQVIKERKQLASQRENLLNTGCILEKPKGVDIGLTVRLLEDSYRHIFDVCYLFTSDADFAPVIRAVQAVGRKVVVYGYKDGLGINSDLEYVPDGFFDLGEYMRSYTYKKAVAR